MVNDLAAMVEPVLTAMGYELVDVEFGSGGVLRVVIDMVDRSRAIGLEDCEQVSRQLSHLFNVEDVDYDRLEVASPGLDRPLRQATDFERFCGSRITLRLREPINGRRQFTGVLEGGPGQWVLLWSDLPEPSQRPRRPGERRTKPAVREGVRGRSPSKSAAGAAEASTQRLEFTLEQVEKARLVPQLAF